MSDEAGLIEQLTHLIKVMGRLAKGTTEKSAVDNDLAVLNPNASPLPFYFSVQAADANLFEQVASMGRGHHSLVVADKIYSDEGFLQQDYNYWPSAGEGANIALFGSHIGSFTAEGGGGSLNTSAGHTETVPPLVVHPPG